MQMTIEAAQREVRNRYWGGAYGQAVAGTLWLIAAALAQWSRLNAAIAALVVGGFFIFPITDAIATYVRKQPPLSAGNQLRWLGMQVAFVLPLSMPLLVPIAHYKPALFFPALTILLGAHYAPFAFLYGMNPFIFLCAILVGAGVVFGMLLPNPGVIDTTFTGFTLFAFAAIEWWWMRRDSDV